MVRGTVEFPNSAMDDFVAVKGNGAPLFVLANVVDDIDMAITHVIRGEDLLPTTPRGILVWEALSDLGWTTDGTFGSAGRPVSWLPIFAHLPMLVNEKRQKLSKRRDPVSVESYRDQGYLPDAFVNYLSLLGWGPPGGEEIFTVGPDDRMVPPRGREPRARVLRRREAHPHDGEYIRAMPVEDFVKACQPWLSGERRHGRRTASTRGCSSGWLRWCRSEWPCSTRFPRWWTSSSSTSR